MVDEVLKSAPETGVDVVGTISGRVRSGVSETVDSISGSVDGVYETVAEVSEPVPGILTVGKTIEMISEGSVVEVVVVDGDNVIAVYSDVVVTDDCTVEADTGPKMTRQ